MKRNPLVVAVYLLIGFAAGMFTNEFLLRPYQRDENFARCKTQQAELKQRFDNVVDQMFDERKKHYADLARVREWIRRGDPDRAVREIDRMPVVTGAENVEIVNP